MKADYGFSPDRIRPRNVLPALVFAGLFLIHCGVAAWLSLLLQTDGSLIAASLVSSAAMTVLLAALTRRRRYAVRPILLAALWSALVGFAVWIVLVVVNAGGYQSVDSVLSSIVWVAMLWIVLSFSPASGFLLCAAAAALALRLGWGRPPISGNAILDRTVY